MEKLKTSSLRADDHATIGGILFAVVTPALFWKRANSINCGLNNTSTFSKTDRFSSDTRWSRYRDCSRASNPLGPKSLGRSSTSSRDPRSNTPQRNRGHNVRSTDTMNTCLSSQSFLVRSRPCTWIHGLRSVPSLLGACIL